MGVPVFPNRGFIRVEMDRINRVQTEKGVRRIDWESRRFSLRLHRMAKLINTHNPRVLGSPVSSVTLFCFMAIEHPESSVNELLIPSAEENEKKAEAKLQWLFLPARLFLIIIDIGIALCGVDIGYFASGWS